MFDDVLGHLIQRIETKALAELSTRLAPVDNAPLEVIRKLARHDEISVAGPVLTESARLTEGDLIDIAQTKSQGHLLAISGRAQLNETVTDVLLNRGNRDVASRLASNSNARFSENGFEILVKAGEGDAGVAEKIGLRLDVPLRLLRQLLLRATEAVRNRLLSLSSSENHAEIQRVLAEITHDVSQEVTAPRDFAKAQQLVQLMQRNNQLNEAALLEFANARKYEETVAALSLLCGASIEIIKTLMKGARPDGLLNSLQGCRAQMADRVRHLEKQICAPFDVGAGGRSMQDGLHCIDNSDRSARPSFLADQGVCGGDGACTGFLLKIQSWRCEGIDGYI